MSSPKKNVDIQKQNTMFGDLLAIEKESIFLTERMNKDIQSIEKLKKQFSQLQKQAKISLNESVNKSNEEINNFQLRIKNYLLGQKAQYTRLSSQINQMIETSKQINGQLSLLGNKFEDFQKNVGV